LLGGLSSGGEPQSQDEGWLAWLGSQSFEGGNIAPAQASNARVQAQDFGPGIGQGLEHLGNALSETAQVADGISAMHDEAAVKEAVNGHDSYYTQLAYTGPNALYAKQGKDALEWAPNVQRAIQEDAKSRRAAPKPSPAISIRPSRNAADEPAIV
jgi:hypothetical protein